MQRIPIAGPSITDREIRRVTEAVTHAWYEDAGAPVETFERAFAAHVGRTFATSLPSCTSGLHLVLAALDVGPGDEVIVPELTWIASAAPISYVGAIPVFADVDAETLCVTPETVRACVTPRTKALIVVDLYGAMPDMAGLLALSEELGIPLIEDAAQAIGSHIGDRPAGNFGVASAFSFHGSKTMTTGEGGMVVCDDSALQARIDVLRDHGRRPGDRAFNNREVAYKYKMSALQAALGHAQLERLDELVALKNQLHQWYVDRLTGTTVTLMTARAQGVVWWMNSVMVEPETGWDKDRLQARLATVGVDSRPVFRPLSSLPAYADEPQAAAARDRNSVSYQVSPWGLNLPSALALTESEVDLVCRELLTAVGERP